MVKTIGILGGMGPMATVDLFRKIVRMTQAETDQEHIPILIDNNTQIPDRTAAILHGGQDPRPALLCSAKRLQAMGAQLLVMPCNTAHHYYAELANAVNIPILNMIEEAAAEAAQLGLHTVGLLATEGATHSDHYEDALYRRDIRVVKPDAHQQRLVDDIIYNGIKAGNDDYDPSAFRLLLKELAGRGAQVFMLGCTELPLVFENYHLNEPSLDPTTILAARAVIEAGGQLIKHTPIRNLRHPAQ